MRKLIVSSLLSVGIFASSVAMACSGGDGTQKSLSIHQETKSLYEVELRFPQDSKKTAELLSQAEKLTPEHGCYEDQAKTYPTHQETARAKALRLTKMANCLEG